MMLSTDWRTKFNNDAFGKDNKLKKNKMNSFEQLVVRFSSSQRSIELSALNFLPDITSIFTDFARITSCSPLHDLQKFWL